MKKITSILLILTLIITLLPSTIMASKDKILKTSANKQTEKEISYNIKFKSTSSKENKDRVKEKIKNNNGIVQREHNKLNALTVKLSKRALKEIKDDDTVEYIEYNSSYEKQENTVSQPFSWNTQYIGADFASQNNISGKGVKVAVFDTGISNHTAYKISGGISFINTEPTYEDFNGHGTHVAGIISGTTNGEFKFGIAPDVELYAVKVLNKDGYGQFSNVIEGIEWAIENKINIINMSFGSIVDSRLVEDAINLAYQNNILVIASAGNDGSTSTSSVMFPAAYKKVIAVGAIDENKQHTVYSSTGEKIEVVAPGDSIYSTMLNNSYDIKSGTSMASAHVAGVASLLWSKDLSRTNGAIRGLIQSSATPLDGNKNYYGNGLVSVSTALKSFDAYMSSYAIGSELEQIPERVASIYNTEIKEEQGLQPYPSKPNLVDGVSGASSNLKQPNLQSDNSTDGNISIQYGSFDYPTTLGLDSWVSESIVYPGDQDWFRFYAPVSGTYIIQTSGSMDTMGTLYNNSQVQVASDDDSGEGSNFYISAYLQQGWYGYVKVNEYGNDGAGSYSIKVTSPAATPRVISLNYPTSMTTSYSDSISAAGENDWFKFVAPESGTYKIETQSGIDTYGELYDYQYNLITSNDDSGDESNFLINNYIEKGWIAYIRVRHYSSSETGPYTLRISLNDDYGNTYASAYSLGSPLNISKDSSINYAGDVDIFKYTANADNEIDIYSEGTTDVKCTILDNSTNTVLASNDDTPEGGSTNFKIGNFRLVSNQVIFIKVEHYSSSQTGDYRLNVKFKRNFAYAPNGGIWNKTDDLIVPTGGSGQRISKVIYFNNMETKHGLFAISKRSEWEPIIGMGKNMTEPEGVKYLEATLKITEAAAQWLIWGFGIYKALQDMQEANRINNLVSTIEIEESSYPYDYKILEEEIITYWSDGTKSVSHVYRGWRGDYIYGMDYKNGSFDLNSIRVLD